MQTTIGAFDKSSATVPVKFIATGPGGVAVTHARDVNACLTAAGKYDADATAARVNQVAAGVAIKIANGAIANPPEPPASTEPPAAS